MLEVKVNIEADRLADAIIRLADALEGSGKSTPTRSKSKTAKAEKAGDAKGYATPINAPEQPVVPTQEKEIEVAGPALPWGDTQSPQPDEAPTEDATPKEITLDMLCEAGASLVDNDRMADVMALLKKYGVQVITQLKPEQYPLVAEDFRALGAML